MKFSDVKRQIDELFDSYVKVWEDVCNIESPTRDKVRVDSCSQYIVDLASRLGWRIERYPQKIAGDIITLTLNPDSAEAPLSLSGHIDTVHAVGVFGDPPVTFDAEKIYGPGVTDCKGGVVSSLLAMDALTKLSYNGRPIQLILQSDEEVGSSISDRQTIDYICERAQGSVAFLNMEGTGRGTVTTQRKGIVTLTFTVKGVAGHSANCAKLGANAIVEAASKILEIDKIKDNDGITCNCGIIKGGTVINAIPDECVFQVNVRYATPEQLDWILNYAEELANKVYVPGCTTTFTRSRGRIPMVEAEYTRTLFNRINEIFQANGLDTVQAAHSNGGSDASEVSDSGVPTIDSLGVFGGYVHSTKEYAYIESLRTSAYRIAAIALNI